jgi:hypothetical protein
MPSPGEECRIAPWRRFMASVELYSSCRKEIDKWFSNIMLEDTAFPNLIQVLHVQLFHQKDIVVIPMQNALCRMHYAAHGQ